MQAVIVTGGRGTRLRPVTDSVPKGMVEIGGRPFLEHLIVYLRRTGVTGILLCTGYRGEMIESYFGDGDRLGLRIDYSLEDRPLGTGGALKRAWPKLEDAFFLLNGDTLLPADYRQLRVAFEKTKALMMVSVFPGEAPGLPPNLRVEGGRITACAADSPAASLTHADAGVRMARKAIADYFPPEDVFSLEEDLYPRLIEAGELGAWPVERKFYDIGTPERVRIFEQYLKVIRDV
ncbi:MAG: sugar phosphate nucleotidyltransferase [PVC group bacterium]